MAAHTIYILSGGAGASGEQLAHTVLAQFPGDENPVEGMQARPVVTVVPGLRSQEQIDEIINIAVTRASSEPIERNIASGGISNPASVTLLVTLVDPNLRRYSLEAARKLGLPTFDLMGPLIEHLERELGRPALGEPGLYRRLNKAYFDRVAAINFAMAHDDGLRLEGLPLAEIVLLGVSRVGKTPLAMYLAVLGWKTANVPIIPGMEPPPQLDQLERGKVFGLTIEPAELSRLRAVRSRGSGAPGGLTRYTDPSAIYEELQAAEVLFKRHGFTLIDVTNRPLESNADEILRRIAARPRGE